MLVEHGVIGGLNPYVTPVLGDPSIFPGFKFPPIEPLPELLVFETVFVLRIDKLLNMDELPDLAEVSAKLAATQ
jgi:hypothetical protein